MTESTDSGPGETPLTRRSVTAAVLAVLGLSGCTAPSVVGAVQDVPVERGDWQLSNVKVEQQHSFVGASALVYNAQGIRERRVKVRFRLYDGTGTKRYDGTDWVRIGAGEERHVAKWWQRDRPGTTSPNITAADVEIVDVST